MCFSVLPPPPSFSCFFVQRVLEGDELGDPSGVVAAAGERRLWGFRSWTGSFDAGEEPARAAGGRGQD